MNPDRWTPPDFSDIALVASLIAHAAPDAEPVSPLRVLGEGFFSVAFETASGSVFRLGTDPSVFARYENEWRLLPHLAASGLPFAIPAPRWLFAPAEGMPFGGIGYPKLPGEALVDALFVRADQPALAHDIASVALALHQLPTGPTAELAVPTVTAADNWTTAERERALMALRDLLAPAELVQVAGWWDACMEDRALREHPFVLTHGDLSDENFLVDPSIHLCGVLDFEYASVGDPARDFAGVRYFSIAFRDAVLREYERLGGERDDGMLHRLDRYWQRSAFYSIRRDFGRDEMKSRSEVVELLREHKVL